MVISYGELRDTAGGTNDRIGNRINDTDVVAGIIGDVGILRKQINRQARETAQKKNGQ